MRIMIIHNFYRRSSPSGENSVVENEIRELRKKHEVNLFSVESDNVVSNITFLDYIQIAYNFTIVKKLNDRLREFKPDIVHIHNTFPFISNSIYSVLENKGVPVINTFHNYRSYCAAGIPLLKGKECNKCHRHGFQEAVKNKCYRDSFLGSLLAGMFTSSFKHLSVLNKSTNNIFLTHFQYEKIASHIGENINYTIKPNFYASAPNLVSHDQRNDMVLFVGRLGVEKGIVELVEFWKKFNIRTTLKIIGDGPLKEFVKNTQSGNIEYLGSMSNKDTVEYIRYSKYLIVPSLWFEGFPLVMMEAIAHQVPIIGNEIGGVKEIIDSAGGYFIKFGPDFKKDLEQILTNNNEYSIICERYKEYYIKNLDRKENINILESIYLNAIKN